MVLLFPLENNNIYLFVCLLVCRISFTNTPTEWKVNPKKNIYRKFNGCKLI